MKHLTHILMAIGVALAPVYSIMLTALTLIGIDLITGILASRKQKKPITSSGFRRTLIKFAIYEIAIITAFLTQTYLTGDIMPVSNIVTAFIGLTEFTSILENLNIISGGKLLKALIDKLGKKDDK